MGCDIHLYVEYQTREGSDYWFNFGSEFGLDRNYKVFSRLAGVRNYGEDAEHIFPRGLPDNLGYVTEDETRYYISEEEGHKNATPEEAKRWGGISKCGKWVDDPDNHTYSWLTVDEYEKAIDVELVEHSVDYKALLAALKVLEEGMFDVRVGFWFDN